MRLNSRLDRIEVAILPPLPRSVRIPPDVAQRCDAVMRRIWENRHEDPEPLEVIRQYRREQGLDDTPEASWFIET